MRARGSTFLGIVAWVCACTCAGSGARAQARDDDPPPTEHPRTCIEVIRWSGDAERVDAIRTALGSGTLATLPPSRCEGVEVHVTPRRGATHVTVRRGEQVVRYASRDASSLPSWIESWLLPESETPATVALGADPTTPARRDDAAAATTATPADPAVEAATDANGARPDEAPRSATERRPGAESRDGEAPDGAGRVGAARVAAARATRPAETTPSARDGVPLLGLVRVGGQVDDIAPTWTLATIEVAVGIGDSVWLSLAPMVAWSPEQSDTERFALSVAARVGYRYASAAGLLRLGLGAGVVSASARREWDTETGQIVRDDEEIAPLVEVCVSYELALGRSWALSIGGSLRGVLPDDAFDGGDAPGESRMPYADPSPLPVVAATLEIGIAYGVGGPW